MAKFFIQTFGCRCNQADSAAIRGGLCGLAHGEAERAQDADLVVVNTCTVTQRTDQQVRQALSKVHRENPHARVVVTGCYAERDPSTLASLPGVSLVLGNHDKERLAEIVEEEPEETRGKAIRTPADGARDFLIAFGAQTGGKTRPFVKLQDGCDARCSYCIVPAVRGPSRSARPDDVLQEVRSLIARGSQEIVLTGVHLGAFGRRSGSPVRLADLLRSILQLPGLGRLRLSSIEPMGFDRDIVKLAEENPSFARHFHIPLQSGSDSILRRMRRPYKAARLLGLLEFIRKRLPEAGIGTDVLVGFPGESDADFEATCQLIRKAPLTYLHVFPFSPREGTPAFTLPGRLPASVVRERARIVRELSQGKNLAFRQDFLGRVLPGITLARDEEMSEGSVLTGNYIHARVPQGGLEPNRLVNVRIDRARPEATWATVV